jgi:hypothetical protein
MALQILRVWAKGPPIKQDETLLNDTLKIAGKIFGTLTLQTWGDVNLKEKGPLPDKIGFKDQDYVDADTADAKSVERARDLYLDANHRLAEPVYVLFVVPAAQLQNANGFSLRSGFCSVLPVPTGAWGTPDGHTYAHEIAHGLSLGHVQDTDNLMYPYRVVEKNVLSGDALTVAQYKEIFCVPQEQAFIVQGLTARRPVRRRRSHLPQASSPHERERHTGDPPLVPRRRHSRSARMRSGVWRSRSSASNFKACKPPFTNL